MWNSIKSILRDNKTKCIIIEEGRPKYIVIPLEEYRRLQKGAETDTMKENPQESSEEVNGEMQELHAEGMEGDSSAPAVIKLEDLPF